MSINCNKAALALTAICLAFSSVALASGQLPPTPMIPEDFRNHKACVARLAALEAEYRAQGEPKPTQREPNVTAQRLYISKGIQKQDKNTTNLVAELGMEVRSTYPERMLIQTSYSYERYSWECKGKTLTGTLQKGYMTPGMEPILAETTPVKE